jgi:hypothetical protein
MLRCRLRTESVALSEEGYNGSSAIFVPSGTILEVPDDFANATRFVKVDWDGEWIQMFASDLRERGELINTRSATGSAR